MSGWERDGSGQAAAVNIHTVPFSGAGSGDYELTWAQTWLWRIFELNAPYIESFNMRAVVPLEPGTRLTTALEAVGRIIGRYSTLRTRFYVNEYGTPRQVVVATGTLRIEEYVCAAADTEDDDRAAESVAEKLSSAPFTSPEISVRVAIVGHGGIPKHIVLSVFHMATDAWGLERMTTDLSRTVRVLAEGGDDVPKERPVHPSDRVAYERTTRGLTQSMNSVRNWEQQVARFGPQACPAARHIPLYPAFREMTLHSEALPPAVEVLSRRFRVSVPALFIGVTAALLCRRTGNSGVGFLVLSHNRIGRNWVNMSGTMTQNFPVYVEVAARELTETFRDIDRRCSAGMLAGQYDPAHLASSLAELAHREGFTPDLSCGVNVIRGEDGEVADRDCPPPATVDDIRRLMKSTTVVAGTGLNYEDMDFYLVVVCRPAETMISLRANTSMFSLSEMEELVRDVESAVVELL